MEKGRTTTSGKRSPRLDQATSPQPRSSKKTLSPSTLAVLAISPEIKAILNELGADHPDSLLTKQASDYLTRFKGVKTAASTLEVMRSRGVGPRYRKVRSRVFYSLAGLDEYAAGVEIKIFDPSVN